LGLCTFQFLFLMLQPIHLRHSPFPLCPIDVRADQALADGFAQGGGGLGHFDFRVDAIDSSR